MSRVIDLNKKLDIEAVTQGIQSVIYKADNQDFYKSPSGKMVHLAEKLPNGDYWIVKSWRTENAILL